MTLNEIDYSFQKLLDTIPVKLYEKALERILDTAGAELDGIRDSAGEDEDDECE